MPNSGDRDEEGDWEVVGSSEIPSFQKLAMARSLKEIPCLKD